MTRIHKIMAGAALLAIGVIAASGQIPTRSDAPAPPARDASSLQATRPAVSQLSSSPRKVSLLAPRPITSDYSVLMRRSIFARDHMAKGYVDLMVNRNAGPLSPEAKLIFRGAMREGTQFVASVEDTGASNKTYWVRVGEKLPAGMVVVEITLDHIIGQKDGARRRVELGQSLEGTRIVETPPTPAPAAATASSAGTASENSIEEMMRRRRLQELGQ